MNDPTHTPIDIGMGCIKPSLEAMRQAAIASERQLCKEDVCMYCGGRTGNSYERIPEGPNEAGNWVHRAETRFAKDALCQASAIFAREAFSKSQPRKP